MLLVVANLYLRRAHTLAADNRRKATDVKIAKLWRQSDGKREKQNLLTGGNDLQLQQDGKGRIAAAVNGV